ncbi:MAG TPA: S8 family serine peptidase [Nitrososphaera sp.]|nr:S8 family serine peptidase [Nitrososphaera sp.]
MTSAFYPLRKDFNIVVSLNNATARVNSGTDVVDACNKNSSSSLLSYQYPLPSKNVSSDRTKVAYSGFIILRLSSSVDSLNVDEITEVAHLNKLAGLAQLLAKYRDAGIKSRRLVRSLSPTEILKLERKTAASKLAPLHSLTLYWRLDTRNLAAQEQDKLVGLLNELPEVSLAYRERDITEPSPPVNAADDIYAANQCFLDAAPVGIDARWVWTQPNGDGSGIGIMDLEQGWFQNHEDLRDKSPTLVFNDNRNGIGGYKGDHGTAVLGIVIGVDNALGIIGIAPGVTSVRMVSHYESSTNTWFHVADAIVAAVAAMPAGDVLLLEVERSYLPTEVDEADFDAIRLAVANGIIVVEAAGNGYTDLDAWTDVAGNHSLNRGSPTFRESGSIMVGAAASQLSSRSDGRMGHDRMDFTNFGSRIDCYAWGENVVSTGYGTLSLGISDDNTYTNIFDGTSAASAIIAGAAVALQGVYRALGGTRLSPGQIRALLSDPATGTPQGTGLSGNIGFMPNLRAIIEGTLRLTADVYLRDNVGDTGSIPNNGGISASPDVIVLPEEVTNPTASFGEGSGTENIDTLGHQVEAGQDNFIYIRMKNRGGSAANNVTATVYWSEVSTLITPNNWNLIGTSLPVNVPIGDTLVVANAITWRRNSIPGTGHYCFVALLDHPQDPAPQIPLLSGFDWNSFRAFVRNNNSVTWRNFDVVDITPDPQAEPVRIDFFVAGAPDKARIFDLEIIQKLPEGAKVWWEVPLGLYAAMPKDLFVEAKTDEKIQTITLLLPRLRSIPLSNVKLAILAHHKCRFIIEGAKGYKNGLHSIAIRQLFEGEEVGRVTRVLSTQQNNKKYA